MDIWTKKKRCRKHKYHNPDKAYQSKLKLERQYRKELFIYYCINCDYYHLTSDQFHNQIPNFDEAFNETPTFTRTRASNIATYVQAQRKQLFLDSRSVYIGLAHLYGHRSLQHPGRSLQRNRKVLR
jgi:hypothetical protein